MSFLRQGFAREGISTCAGIAALKDGDAVRTAGVVLVRQRPGTGVVCFITLEDETAIANLVILPKVFDRYRKTIMAARLLEVHGRIQKSPEGIVHVMAHRLVDRSRELSRLAEPELDLGLDHVLSRADEVKKGSPGGSRPPHAHHPRNVRIIPPSRDFH